MRFRDNDIDGPGKQSPMRILAVDDDALMRDIVSETLRACGYDNITLAAAGHEALDLIDAAPEPFDCFLLDIQMPEMDGIELCAAIRALPAHVRTPILMVTTVNQKDYIDRAFQAGATDYVTKPIDMMEFQSRIRVAEKLQAEVKRASAPALLCQAAPAPMASAAGDFADAVTIGGVAGVLGLNEIQNYVKQLARGQHFMTGAFAISIAQIEEIFFTSSSEDFTYVLADMATVISDLLAGSDTFISYIGGGIFLVVGQKSRFPAQTDLHPPLIHALNDSDLVFVRNWQGELNPIIGDVASPGLFGRGGGLEFLDKAVASALRKESSSPRTEFSAPGRSVHEERPTALKPGTLRLGGSNAAVSFQ